MQHRVTNSIVKGLKIIYMVNLGASTLKFNEEELNNYLLNVTKDIHFKDGDPVLLVRGNVVVRAMETFNGGIFYDSDRMNSYIGSIITDKYKWRQGSTKKVKKIEEEYAEEALIPSVGELVLGGYGITFTGEGNLIVVNRTENGNVVVESDKDPDWHRKKIFRIVSVLEEKDLYTTHETVGRLLGFPFKESVRRSIERINSEVVDNRIREDAPVERIIDDATVLSLLTKVG